MGVGTSDRFLHKENLRQFRAIPTSDSLLSFCPLPFFQLVVRLSMVLFHRIDRNPFTYWSTVRSKQLLFPQRRRPLSMPFRLLGFGSTTYFLRPFFFRASLWLPLLTSVSENLSSLERPPLLPAVEHPPFPRRWTVLRPLCAASFPFWSLKDARSLLPS